MVDRGTGTRQIDFGNITIGDLNDFRVINMSTRTIGVIGPRKTGQPPCANDETGNESKGWSSLIADSPTIEDERLIFRMNNGLSYEVHSNGLLSPPTAGGVH